MRSVGRLAALGACVAVPVVGAAVTAAAADAVTARPPVLQSAWYWEHAATALGSPVAPPASEPSGVPAGDLAVAYTGDQGGNPSKETYLAFDVSALPSGSQVTAFTFTLPLDTSQPQQTASPPSLVACLPTRQWSSGDGVDATQKPTDDCSAALHGKFTGSGYTFSVPTYAQSWVTDVNLGVAIRNAPDYTTPFQIVFKGARSVTASATFVPAPGSAGTSTAGSTVAPGATTVGAPAPAPAPSTPLGVPMAPSGPVAAPAPQVAAAPSVAPAAPAKRILLRAASVVPTGGFWFAAVGLAVVVVGISLVLGDADVLTAMSGREARFDRVLRAKRRRTASGGPSDTTVAPGLA